MPLPLFHQVLVEVPNLNVLMSLARIEVDIVFLSLDAHDGFLFCFQLLVLKFHLLFDSTALGLNCLMCFILTLELSQHLSLLGLNLFKLTSQRFIPLVHFGHASLVLLNTTLKLTLGVLQFFLFQLYCFLILFALLFDYLDLLSHF